MNVCNKTPFNDYSYETHKHVVTGGTNIISNYKVKNFSIKASIEMLFHNKKDYKKLDQ